MIHVTNTGRTPVVVTLDAGIDYGPDYAPRTFTMTVPVELEGGGAGVRHHVQQVPATVRWAPGETRDLPDAVADVAQVRAFVHQKVLRIAKIAEAPKPEAVETAEPPVASTSVAVDVVQVERHDDSTQ